MEVLIILMIMAICAIIVTLFMDVLAAGSAGLKDKDLGESLIWIRAGLQGIAVALMLVVVWML